MTRKRDDLNADPFRLQRAAERKAAKQTKASPPTGMHDLDAGEGARSGWHCRECPKGISTHGGTPHIVHFTCVKRTCARGYNDNPGACFSCGSDVRPVTERFPAQQVRASALHRALVVSAEACSIAVLATHRARMNIPTDPPRAAKLRKRAERIHAELVQLVLDISAIADLELL